jgi:hypothetical protein
MRSAKQQGASEHAILRPGARPDCAPSAANEGLAPKLSLSIDGWIAAGAEVTVIDTATGDDITRILFARWEAGRPVDPIGERDA